MPPRPTKPFAYYARLSAADKKIYRRSDAISETPLHDPGALKPLARALREALDTGERRTVQVAAAKFSRALLEDLGVSPVVVEILESRPRNDYGELHGLYTFDPAVTHEKPRIQVWMRTAAHGRIVAWKSFLRTLLHELGHHLDYHHLDLADSFHTQGFYQRESSLYAQIADEEQPQQAKAPRPTAKGKAGKKAAPRAGEKPAPASAEPKEKKSPGKQPKGGQLRFPGL